MLQLRQFLALTGASGLWTAAHLSAIGGSLTKFGNEDLFSGANLCMRAQRRQHSRIKNQSQMCSILNALLTRNSPDRPYRIKGTDSRNAIKGNWLGHQMKGLPSANP